MKENAVIAYSEEQGIDADLIKKEADHETD